MKHAMLILPYAQDALAPRMSAETLAFHHGKHLQTYIDNLNRLAEGTPYADMPLKEIVQKADGALLNNAAQAWNHILFFKQLTPQPVNMSSALTQTISARFGSVEAFREARAYIHHFACDFPLCPNQSSTRSSSRSQPFCFDNPDSKHAPIRQCTLADACLGG